jgi:hypothetical protein
MDQFSLEPLPPSLPGGGSHDDPCHRPCGLFRHLLDKLANDDRLATRLLIMREVELLLNRYQPDLDAGRAALVSAHGAALGALRALGTFVTLGEPAASARSLQRVESRHAGDGAEDRRRRPPWPRWLPWTVLVAAGVFETWFFGQIFRFLAGVDFSTTEGKATVLIAYLPGLLLAVALLLAGSLMGEQLIRRKHAKEGWPAGDMARPTWELALPLVLVLLAVVGALAWARARFLGAVNAAQSAFAQGQAGSVSGGDIFPEWAVIVLIMMVTVAAIGMKAAAHNPFANSADEARRDLDTILKKSAGQCAEVEHALLELERAWDDVRGTLLLALNAVQDRWVMLLRAWPEERQPEDGDPRWESAVPPDHPATSATGSALPDVDRSLAWLERTPEPLPALGPLRHARQVLLERPPDPLWVEFRRLVSDLDNQLARDPR